MFKYVQQVDYMVKDRDEMVAFVERTFGLKPDKVLEGPASDTGGLIKEARYLIGETLMRIRQPDQVPSSKRARFLREHGPGVYHIAWVVDQDIPEVAKDLKKKGVTLCPDDEPKGYHDTILGSFAMAIEPEDNPLGLHFEMHNRPKEGRHK